MIAQKSPLSSGIWQSQHNFFAKNTDVYLRGKIRSLGVPNASNARRWRLADLGADCSEQQERAQSADFLCRS